jgi:hypothetical protein
VYVSRHVVFSETEFPACILTNNGRADCTESRSDYSDSGISRGTGTHSRSDEDSEANSEFEGDGEAFADGGQDQDEEEDQDDEEDQDEVDHENQDGAGEIVDDEYAE